ncbi:MAG: hypothetical protein A3G75_15480, partial [Verrucomicrobia bacterium RIFCSPLOWO2_12_FULL_64_8]
MSDSSNGPSAAGKIEQEAAAWVLRCDRGLTPGEQDDFSQWLASDRRHGGQFARHRMQWDRLDQLVEWCPEHGARPNPDLLAPARQPRVRRFVSLSLGLAAAAAAILAGFLLRPEEFKPSPGPRGTIARSTEAQRVLPDGSIIDLNQGAAVAVNSTAGDRRVRLEKGEAHFTVAKDAARPFIVTARGVDVRAVGTAFDVRMDSATVEVLVTEGRVEVSAAPSGGTVAGPDGRQPGEGSLVPVLAAHQRVVV